MIAKGIFIRQQAAVIADRCLCAARLCEAENEVGKHGLTMQGARGEVANPAVRIARAYRVALQRWDSELGLLPSSRASIHLPEPSPCGMSVLERALCGGGPMDPIEPTCAATTRNS